MRQLELLPMQEFFVIDLQAPWRTIKVMELGLRATKMRAWAEDRETGRRRLIGSTAFYTRAGAERAKLGAMQKIWSAREKLKHRHGHLLDAVFKQLKRYQEEGTVH